MLSPVSIAQRYISSIIRGNFVCKARVPARVTTNLHKFVDEFAHYIIYTYARVTMSVHM